MFENLQKLVSTEKISILFLRISILHEIKQNEKYPYADARQTIVDECNKYFIHYSVSSQ